MVVHVRIKIEALRVTTVNDLINPIFWTSLRNKKETRRREGYYKIIIDTWVEAHLVGGFDEEKTLFEVRFVFSSVHKNDETLEQKHNAERKKLKAWKNWVK